MAARDWETRVCVSVYIYLYMYVYISVCLYVRMYIYMYVNMYVYMCACMYYNIVQRLRMLARMDVSRSHNGMSRTNFFCPWPCHVLKDSVPVWTRTTLEKTQPSSQILIENARARIFKGWLVFVQWKEQREYAQNLGVGACLSQDHTRCRCALGT